MSSFKKQKALDKKRRLRRLRKKQRQSSFLPPNAAIVHNPPGMAKMSEVLLDFVEPYMKFATTEEALRKLVTLACVAWNAALLPLAEREELIRKTEETLPAKVGDDFRAILDPLIARKQEHFAENRRGIFNFELTMGPAGPYLQVMSTLGA